MTTNNNNADEQVFTLRDLALNYMALGRRGVRYWFRGAAVFTVFFLLGMVWVMTRQRVFKSEATFQVVESTVTGEHSDSNEEQIQRSVEARLNQVYGSRRYMMNIIRENHVYDHLLGVRPDGRPVTSETKVVDLFNDAIDRRVTRNIVKIGFVYRDPMLAQQVVQSLIRLFVNERKMASEEQARETLSLVEGQLGELEGVLVQRQEALDQLTLANPADVATIRMRHGVAGVVQPGVPVPVVAPVAASNDHSSPRTRRLRARSSELQRSIEMLRNPTAAPAPSNEDTPEIRGLRERVAEKRNVVSGLRARGLMPDHPSRAAAERELADLEGQLNGAIGRNRGVAPPRDTLSDAERASRIEQLTHDLSAARSELNDSERADSANGGLQNPTVQQPVQPSTPQRPAGQLPNIVAVEAAYDRLINDLQGTRNAYNELLRRKLERMSDLRRIQLAGGETVRIIDPPSRPVDPEPPGRTRLASIALFLALLAGLGTSVVSGFLDTRVYDITDLRRWGELPELPYIPELHLDAPTTPRDGPESGTRGG
jgi:uncharacterized protein involved in exopolysaccharide biosynthesis